MEELIKFMKAGVLLQLSLLDESEEKPKPELLLHRAGMSNKEIAEMLGKMPDAVRMAIARAKKTGSP